MKLKLLGAALTLVTLAHGSALLTLTPGSGAISATAGSTTGWGFTLSDSSDFAVVTSSNFCLGSSGVNTACAPSTLGTYSDYIATNFTIAGPVPESSTVTQAFNPATGSGLGSFLFNPGTAAGSTNVGQIVLTYDSYSVDPLAANFDPDTDLLSTGNFVTAPATGNVTSATVPEINADSAAASDAILLGILLICRGRSPEPPSKRLPPERKSQ